MITGFGGMTRGPGNTGGKDALSTIVGGRRFFRRFPPVGFVLNFAINRPPGLPISGLAFAVVGEISSPKVCQVEITILDATDCFEERSNLVAGQ